ncbi:MAG: hypothetical protein K8R88_04050 [Armatimonadetes bacterium]|nr:hypothetical protein [Armatimonadota bacterium]
MLSHFLVSAIALNSWGKTPDRPFLSPAFSDHMVMQRGRVNTFWGWGAPGSGVRVSVDGKTGFGVADQSGKWVAKVNPPKVGGPYTVSIDGDDHVELKDVMVGDVWICSGQSNMEMGVGVSQNGAAEVAAANDPMLRLYVVPRTISPFPLASVPGSWDVCTPETILKNNSWGGFSAAGYFFGRELRKELQVPIGLVDTSWGGTIAESWTSKAGLAGMPEFTPRISEMESRFANPGVTYEQQVSNWLEANDPGEKNGWGGADVDVADWKRVKLPSNFVDLGLGEGIGTHWFRNEFMLPPGAENGLTLNLGPIDDMDTVWVNGERVGATMDWSADRKYVVAGSFLRPGKNTIAIRVMNLLGPGGFSAKPENFCIQVGSGVTALAGDWQYHAGSNPKTMTAMPQASDAENPNRPTLLYNGMIAPILPLAMKGAIWYQGESNADRAYQYRDLLPAMIGDWRKAWGQGDFPFFIVQLASFYQPSPQPVESYWAELREAQFLTTRRVKNTGIAVATDIGDPVDIHPKNKQEVGRRLALAALKTAYGKKIAFAGPTYKSFKIEGSSIRLAFDHLDGGLTVQGDALKGFAIAGADKKFYWAEARVDGRMVVVGCADVPNPVAVRYAWANNPEATLFNGAGLPAVPFRTDDWPGLSVGRK